MAGATRCQRRCIEFGDRNVLLAAVVVELPRGECMTASLAYAYTQICIDHLWTW